MLVTRLARSFGIFEHPTPLMLTRIDEHPLNPCLFREAQIVSKLGGGNYSVSFADPVVAPGEHERRNRRRMDEVSAQKPPYGHKLPIDPYSVMSRAYQDEKGMGMNYLRRLMDATMHHLAISRPEAYLHTFLHGMSVRQIEEVKLA